MWSFAPWSQHCALCCSSGDISLVVVQLGTELLAGWQLVVPGVGKNSFPPQISALSWLKRKILLIISVSVEQSTPWWSGKRLSSLLGMGKLRHGLSRRGKDLPIVHEGTGGMNRNISDDLSQIMRYKCRIWCTPLQMCQGWLGFGSTLGEPAARSFRKERGQEGWKIGTTLYPTRIKKKRGEIFIRKGRKGGKGGNVCLWDQFLQLSLAAQDI